MKQLICEMCGSTDLMKQAGVFVCQSCGTKYSVEEAKKMMVEGTVKVDNSEKLENLYQIARQSRDIDDAENVAKYYDMIMQEDPNSWEATFYNVYYRAMQTKIAYIASAATSVKNSLSNVFMLLNKDGDIENQTSAVLEISLRVMNLCVLLESNARRTFKESWDRGTSEYGAPPDMWKEYSREYHARAQAIYLTLFEFGDLVEKYFPDNLLNMVQTIAVTFWKRGIEYWIDFYLYFDTHEEDKTNMYNSYVAKIRKYEPTYDFPTPNWDGLPTFYKNFFANVLRRSNAQNNTTAEGCYVATAVYGSYDCPEVWILRRYRDYSLAQTWYGRAFIHTYYAISPTLVKWFGHTNWFKSIWKGKLDRMVKNLQEKGFESTPYEDRKW